MIHHVMSQAAHVQNHLALYECPGLHWRWVMLHGLEVAALFLGKPDEVLE